LLIATQRGEFHQSNLRITFPAAAVVGFRCIKYFSLRISLKLPGYILTIEIAHSIKSPFYFDASRSHRVFLWTSCGLSKVL